MMTKTILLFVCVAYAAAQVKECRPGYWGDDCNNACGACEGADTCNKVNGACTSAACQVGYESSSDNKCDIPICFADQGCDNGGKCVAPNYCVCGEAGAQTVGLFRNYNGIEGINCVNLRTDGLKGCLIAFVILTLSISFCGLIAEKRIRSKAKKA